MPTKPELKPETYLYTSGRFSYPPAELSPELMAALKPNDANALGQADQEQQSDLYAFPEEVRKISEQVESPLPPKKRSWGQFFASLCGSGNSDEKSEQKEQFLKKASKGK